MLRPRDDGSGGRDGIVLNMTMSGDGTWNAVYSVQAYVGKNLQPVMLSVDTGSSDIWLASSSCSSCSSAHTTLYDPSAAIQTGQDFSLSYLRGSVSGPIVWDDFKLGPYSIPSQAFAAADTVTDESLSSDFVGLMGLALPLNSKIAQLITPTESDAPDGATMQQNVFGLTPVESAPVQRFVSLSLERPGSSRIPSLLGIGRHPSNLIQGFDPSHVAYEDLIPSKEGDTFWRVPMESITAWVDGVPKTITLGRSVAVPTMMYPVALVDTGGSSILASPDIANGIYGAWGIGPGSDGNYYVPCTTPLNISIGLGRIPPIPLHPLDITSLPQTSKSGSSSSTCLGQIQAVSSDTLSSYADIVLGVPFMRNVYTVLSSSSSDNASASTQGSTLPRLGLLPLTDPATAMTEFHNVRVLGQPLDPSASSTSSPNNTSSATVGKKLSVGLVVLVAIVGFFVACGILFAIRWWALRRRFKRADAGEHAGAWGNKKRGRDEEPDEDTLRAKRWEEGKKNGLFYAESSTGSEWTRVEQAWAEEHDRKARQKKDAESRSRSRSPLVSHVSDVGHTHGEGEAMAQSDTDEWGKVVPAMHVRTTSELGAGGISAVPLLEEGESSPWSAEGGGPPAHERPPSHARVPSHERSSSYERTSSHERPSSTTSVSFGPDEFGMTGIGVRNSTVSSSSRRPGVKPRGARAPSGGSVSSVASRTWHAEVGQVLQQVDVPWPAEPERG